MTDQQLDQTEYYALKAIVYPRDTLKLIAEIRRLRAQVAELTEAALVSDPRNDEEPTP